MTKSLAFEVAPVRLNLIAAGFADTPLSASLPGDRIGERREQLRTTPADRPRRRPASPHWPSTS